MTPLPVEIINQTDWWQPYVPPLVGLLGSVIVASVAFIGITKSNRTNLRVIEAADTREREKWQSDSDRAREKWHRDNLLRICSEAVRVSREISHHYNEAIAVSIKLLKPEEFDDAFWERMDAAQAAIDKVAPLSYDMQLLGESGLYMKFQEVRQVGEFVAPAFRQYHRYLVANFTRIRAAREEGGEALKRTTAEVQASLEYRRYAKATAHLSRSHLDFQLAAQQKISPHSLPEGELPSMDMDLPPMPPGLSPNPFRLPSPYDWNAGDTAESESKD
jgi:hypothetical protein